MSKKTIKTASATEPNIFLFHGDDGYTTAQKVKRWTEEFAKKHSGQGIVKIDCSELLEWDKELKVVFESQGLFSSARLVVVKNIFSQKAETTEWLLAKLDKQDAQTFLLFWEIAPVKKILRLYKKLSVLAAAGAAQIFEHVLPFGLELNRFLLKYAVERGYKLSSKAAEKIAVALGRDLVEKSFRGQASAAGVYDLWQATSEIDKLGVYAGGREIQPADVETLVCGKTSDNIFLFTNALGARNEKTARRYLEELFAAGSGGDPKARALPIVGALAAQFRSLLLLSAAQKTPPSDESLAGVLGWTPYRVNANLKILGNFSEFQLREILARLLEVDRQLKSTVLPPKVLLGQLV